MPPTAGETTRSTALKRSRIRWARARQRRSVRTGSMNTNIFCRKTELCRPELSTKWPSSSAPAARNSSRTSCGVMSAVLWAGSSRHALDPAHHALGAQLRDDGVEVLQVPDGEIDDHVREVVRAPLHRDVVDVAVVIGDDL